MSYNPYGGNPYGAPPGYGYGNPPPGIGGAPPGMSAPPGMAAPGMGAPPGMHQANAAHGGRPGPGFQPPNMPNINFNAPVIRLGTTNGPSGSRGDSNRDERSQHSGSRPGLGADRDQGGGRSHGREAVPTLIPPTPDEKQRTMFINNIPEGFGSDANIEKFLGVFGNLKRWESVGSVLPSYKGTKFGFAVFEFEEPFDLAVRLLVEEEVSIPVKRQPGTAETPSDDQFEGIEKRKLEAYIDPIAQKSLDAYREAKDDGLESAMEAIRDRLQQAVRGLFYPSVEASREEDVAMANAENGENVEVVNIPLAQDDELADIPAEMREIVAKEIAAFRDRSTQRDLERLRKEEEMEEIERQRSGAGRKREPPVSATSNIPSGPRVATSAGSNARNGSIGFVNGGTESNGVSSRRDDDHLAIDDEELNKKNLEAEKYEAEKAYNEAERKWSNRERSRQAALERERDRERHGAEMDSHRIEEQLEREKEWNDDIEISKQSHMYYRDHSAWLRKRAIDKADEEARDDADRRAEHDERRRRDAQMERAKGMADSFLDQQAQEMQERETPAPVAAAAPQPFKLSLGAAAQKAASRAGPQRRTIAEVEGLLDNEEDQTKTRRQLIPIEYDASTAAAGMTEEEIAEAVRNLAQEIPSDKDGLWAWQVKWDYMDESVVRDKLRPFVEKKIVEYLGVQEEMLVEAVEEHLRKHGGAAELVEELEGALDDEAEDLVKKLWRMVIFFTESEKRGLPA
ncbi:hypothetical protein VHEMI02291 [[Torrubiella] hemipterigena]|uniref:PWI domain-containing protein n=1 Tax=[Torrubiella] hemipterigena TaxID=1531966 RepID=A0A0A1SP89_9HYPO|nr:hypothetical protein VHEMI02291 [[Torrubiella] hemipterigena]